VHRPDDGSNKTVTLTREIIRVKTVLGDRRNDNGSWDYMYDKEQRIGYVRITAFGRHTGGELRRTLKELTAQEMKGLILDLRFNPGGLLSSAVEVSDLFLSKGRIVSTHGRNVNEQVWNAHGRGTFGRFPMAVLVNQYSASGSEIVAACLQDHGRAVVIGQRTFGKGSVQNVIELGDGSSALKLTTAGYRRPNGKSIDRSPTATESDDWGVHPNEGFEVVLSRAESRELFRMRRARDGQRDGAAEDGKDVQLDRALTHIREQIAKTATDDEVPSEKPGKPEKASSPS
jgi:carboxyl-terminal processing protease